LPANAWPESDDDWYFSVTVDERLQTVQPRLQGLDGDANGAARAGVLLLGACSRFSR
jgi:hypothetical protein